MTITILTIPADKRGYIIEKHFDGSLELFETMVDLAHFHWLPKAEQEELRNLCSVTS